MRGVAGRVWGGGMGGGRGGEGGGTCLGWKRAHETLLMWPRSVSTSHALVSFIRHSFTCRSSAPETMSGSVLWKAAQLTPRSCPSSTYLTVASLPPKRSSTLTLGIALPSLLARELATASYSVPPDGIA